MLNQARDVARYTNLVAKPRISCALRLGERNVSGYNHCHLIVIQTYAACVMSCASNDRPVSLFRLRPFIRTLDDVGRWSGHSIARD